MSSPEKRLVVVNAAKFPEDSLVLQMYCCPARENGFNRYYKHFPAKYIANYGNKGAKSVAIVAACVRLNAVFPAEVLWRFEDISDADAISRASLVRDATERNPRPCLVFLQSELTATDLHYDNRGGLQSSRAYFDLTELAPRSVGDLASKLTEVKWTELNKWSPH